jgi:O-acetyl-ADP-ribose deacetylase (regulator of RNase III)
MIGQHGLARKNKFGSPPVRYDAIRQALRHVATFAVRKNASAHMPRIGAGLAGGNWEVIQRIIEEELSRHSIPVTVYDLPLK